MKWKLLPLVAVVICGLAHPVWGDLDAAAWNKLKTRWNRKFRGDPPTELYQNLLRGNFPDKVFEIAVQDGARVLKMTEEIVKAL